MSVLDAFSLSGKVSVVTGANRGIGRALVTALAEAGSDVVLLVRDTGGAAEVIKELDALGVTAIAVTADVTEPDQVRRAAGEVLDRLGQVDVLVNNAGACIHRPSLGVTAEEWRFVMDVNVNGVWNCAQEFGRQMVAQQWGDHQHRLDLGQDRQPTAVAAAYNASKAAVHQLTRSLAAEWAPHGVRVDALAPGYIKTEMAPVDNPEFKRYWIDDAPMRRYAMPSELGPCVVFLASDASSFMTGEVVVMDGDTRCSNDRDGAIQAWG